MSAGRILRPSRYIVGWRESGVVKVGLTNFGYNRYGAFMERGAELLDVTYFDVPLHALYAEVWLQKRLDKTVPMAFECKDEAVPYLGGSGAGWLECYVVPAHWWPDLVTLGAA